MRELLHARTRNFAAALYLAVLLFATLLLATLLTACDGDSSGDPTTQAADGTGEPSAAAAATTGDDATPGATSGSTTAATAEPAPIDLATYYADNCAICHGSDRDGVGRTPALTPDALTDDIDHYMDETDNRTHNNIWSDTAFTEADRRALLDYLATVAP